MIIFNPKAGQAEELYQQLEAAADTWRAHGWQVEMHPTNGPGDATALARQAASQGYDMVAAAGGDGTINEVVNGLVGSQTALGTLPFGTVNVWARELGLPLQPRLAAEALLQCRVHPIDLGRAGERYFLLMAGVGFDAAITASVDSEAKRRFGVIAYVVRGIRKLLHIRGTRTRLWLDGRQIRGRVLMIVIGNSQLYGGVVKITHQATIDDGLLDVCVIRGNGFWSALVHTIAILRRRYDHNPEITYYRARTVEIAARPSLPVQVDGDTIGYTPMTVEVVPGGLRALMPTNLPEHLLRHRPTILLQEEGQ